MSTIDIPPDAERRVPATEPVLRRLTSYLAWFDGLLLVALSAAAAVYRRGSLPDDGLWFDDSWVAAGAILGSPSELMTVGSGHPGFTGLLMAVNRLGSGSLRDLAVPSLIFGILGPPLLYLVLRRLGHARSVSLLLGALLVAAPVPILYAGRVKGYTLDTLLVLALVVGVTWLARTTWRWPTAVAWVLAAWFVGTFSGYALVATAGAAFVLAVHARSDRWLRVAALAVQGVGQAVYLRVAQSRTDLAGIEKVMETSFDGHMTFHANPVDFARESLKHLRRVAEVFPYGAGGWLTLFALAALAGLVIASVRGRTRSQTIGARYLLLLVAFAFVGAHLEKFPFGTDNSNGLSPGGRHMLWLLPAFAVGLAVVADRIRSIVPRGRARFGLDGVVAVGAAVFLVAGYSPALPYLFQGSASATAYIDAAAREDDAVIVTSTATYSFAISTKEPVHLVPTPGLQVGYSPRYDDPRYGTVGAWTGIPETPARILEMVDGAPRVFVVGSGPLASINLTRVAKVLEAEGYRMEQRTFGSATVQIWRRTSGG